MNPLRKLRHAAITSVVLAAILAGAPPALARVDFVPDGSCGFKLTFHLQYFGPGADSAFAAGAKADILNCWKDLKVDCCSLRVEVDDKVGVPTRCGGYDSVYVADQTVTPWTSTAQIGDLNGADHHAAWGNQEPQGTYGHEVGHLTGLDDCYEVVSGTLEYVKDHYVDTRVTQPRPGFDGDKMAELAGKVTQRMVNLLAGNAGAYCDIFTCWPDDVSGGDVSGSVEVFGPPAVRPRDGGGTVRLVFKEGQTFFAFWQAQTGGGGFEVAALDGWLDIEIGEPYEIELNPMQDPRICTWRIIDADMQCESFEWTQAETTGANLFELADMPLGLPTSAGFIVDDPPGEAGGIALLAEVQNDGDFEGTVALQITNDLFPPSAPAYFVANLFGHIDYETGLGYMGFNTGPIFFLETTSLPNRGRPVPGIRLAPNYPNPFSAATTLQFQVKDAARATLTVHDVAGRRVRTLWDRETSAGTYFLVWDGRADDGGQVPAGVYFATLAAGGARSSQRVLVVR